MYIVLCDTYIQKAALPQPWITWEFCTYVMRHMQNS